jgi:threonine dehydratase
MTKGVGYDHSTAVYRAAIAVCRSESEGIVVMPEHNGADSGLVTLDAVRAAAARIAGVAVRTPLLPCLWSEPKRPLLIKPESLQPTGAFKTRGAVNAVAALDPTDRAPGILTQSSGNHGQAIAFAASRFGVPATVVMPDVAPAVKKDAIRALGAEVIEVPTAERQRTADELRDARGMVLVPPYGHPDVIAGQGTIGLEIAADLPAGQPATVLVPVSGGGLVSGVAVAIKALRPDVTVIGVEPELAADVTAGFQQGAQQHWPIEDRMRTIADGLRMEPVELTWRHIRALVDGMLTVTEDEILAAMRTLALRGRLTAEPSGAVTTAAYLSHGDELPPGQPVVAVLSGGNVDPELFARVVNG